MVDPLAFRSCYEEGADLEEEPTSFFRNYTVILAYSPWLESRDFEAHVVIPLVYKNTEYLAGEEAHGQAG